MDEVRPKEVGVLKTVVVVGRVDVEQEDIVEVMSEVVVLREEKEV